MPEHLKDFIVELADRFPDLLDDEVTLAAIAYFPGAVAYTRAVINLYASSIQEL